jgi:serine/threonine-protein kinase
VVDFGIAKLLEAGDGARLTRVGTVVGTPGYMSPEQAQGEVLDPRSDLYSVGVILYEMVTGKLPFSAPAPLGLIGKMLSEKPTPPSIRRPDMAVPAKLEALIMRVLSTDRQLRPASAEEFRKQLLQCLTSEGPAKPPTPRALTTFAGEAARGGPAQAPAKSTPSAGVAPRTQHGSAALAEPAAPLAPPRAGSEVLRALPQLLGSVIVAVAIGGAIVWALGSGGGAFTRAEVAPPVPPAQVSRPDSVARAAAVSSPTGSPSRPTPARLQPAAPEHAKPEPTAGTHRPRASATPAVPRAPPPSATGAPDSLVLPPAESGEGILTVIAEPGAILLLNGTPVGETPREVRVREGSYRVQVRHRVRGSVRATLKVEAGSRKHWAVAFPE